MKSIERAGAFNWTGNLFLLMRALLCIFRRSILLCWAGEVDKKLSWLGSFTLRLILRGVWRACNRTFSLVIISTWSIHRHRCCFRIRCWAAICTHPTFSFPQFPCCRPIQYRTLYHCRLEGERLPCSKARAGSLVQRIVHVHQRWA